MKHHPQFLPSGSTVICCTHVALNGPNQQITIVPFEGPEYDHIRKGVEESEKADWLLLCMGCRRNADQEAGAPYRMGQLEREVSLPG